MRMHHIQSCYRTLERVKSILEKDDTSSLQDQRLETLKRKLRWPFKSSEVQDLIVEIERHKTTLGLALNVDGISGLLRALSDQNTMNESIKEEMRLRREAETRYVISKQRQEVLDSFGAIDPRRNLDMNRRLRHSSTGLWLTESPEYKHWLENKNACVWMYGIPGAGALVDGRNDFYETPLHIAALFGDVEMTELLLESGANPQDQDFICALLL